jgi:O-antigen/teichoic acid export membrane protein
MGIFVLAIPLFANRPGPPSEATTLPLRRILAFGLFAWATNFFVFILGDSSDVLLLGWLVTDRASIGHYAVGAKIVFSLTGLLIGWASLVSVATFSEAFQQGGSPLLALLVGAQWKLSVLCLLGPFLLLMRYGREIIAVSYSSAYAPSVQVLEILTGLTAASVIFGFSLGLSALYATNHERLACGLVGAAAAFNIVAEIILVRSMGILGAAWATGLSILLLALLSATASWFYIPWRFPVLFITKVGVSGALALLPTLWMRADTFFTLVAGCIVWVGVFVAVLAMLKPLGRDDLQALGRIHSRLEVLAEPFSLQAVPVGAGGAR